MPGSFLFGLGQLGGNGGHDESDDGNPDQAAQAT
jgi:hypothetical protein